MNPKDEERLFGTVKDLLDDGVDNLNGRTKQRLEEARIGALNAAGESRWGLFIRRRWIMLGSVATAATASAALFIWLHASPGVLPARQIEDFEIITSQERVDFYPNLDFYRWLAASGNDPEEQEAS
jgi:hypothetical protein